MDIKLLVDYGYFIIIFLIVNKLISGFNETSAKSISDSFDNMLKDLCNTKENDEVIENEDG